MEQQNQANMTKQPMGAPAAIGGAAPQPQSNDPVFKLYIGNLAKTVTSNSLFHFF